MKVIAALAVLTFSLVAAAQDKTPTIGENCRKIVRPAQGDTVWIMFGKRGEVVSCGAIFDAFHGTKWFAHVSGSNAQPYFSTEAMATKFVEEQPYKGPTIR